MRNVAVVFGGKSCENEISIITGIFVMNVLDKEKYCVFPVYIHTDGGIYTSPKMRDLKIFQEKKYALFERIFFDGGSMYALNASKGKIKRIAKMDVAINCCHGGLGEGGGVSAMMAWNEIPLASPGLTPSGVFLDKCLTKVVAQGLGIPTLEYVRVNEEDYRKRGAFLLKRIAAKLKYPVVIKPAHLGSSIGISVARTEEEVKKRIEEAFALDGRVLIEKYLEHKEDVNCAVYESKGGIYVSEPERAFGQGIYTFEDKYLRKENVEKEGRNAEKISSYGRGRCVMNEEVRKKIRAYTKTIYKRMNLKGVVRMDYLTSGDKVYLCEVNTVPGSLAYYLFCERLTDAQLFFGDLLEEAIEKAKKEEKKLLTTGILKNGPGMRK